MRLTSKQTLLADRVVRAYGSSKRHAALIAPPGIGKSFISVNVGGRLGCDHAIFVCDHHKRSDELHSMLGTYADALPPTTIVNLSVVYHLFERGGKDCELRLRSNCSSAIRKNGSKKVLIIFDESHKIFRKKVGTSLTLAKIRAFVESFPDVRTLSMSATPGDNLYFDRLNETLPSVSGVELVSDDALPTEDSDLPFQSPVCESFDIRVLTDRSYWSSLFEEKNDSGYNEFSMTQFLLLQSLYHYMASDSYPGLPVFGKSFVPSTLVFCYEFNLVFDHLLSDFREEDDVKILPAGGVSACSSNRIQIARGNFDFARALSDTRIVSPIVASACVNGPSKIRPVVGLVISSAVQSRVLNGIFDKYDCQERGVCVYNLQSSRDRKNQKEILHKILTSRDRVLNFLVMSRSDAQSTNEFNGILTDLVFYGSFDDTELTQWQARVSGRPGAKRVLDRVKVHFARTDLCDTVHKFYAEAKTLKNTERFASLREKLFVNDSDNVLCKFFGKTSPTHFWSETKYKAMLKKYIELVYDGKDYDDETLYTDIDECGSVTEAHDSCSDSE